VRPAVTRPLYFGAGFFDGSFSWHAFLHGKPTRLRLLTAISTALAKPISGALVAHQSIAALPLASCAPVVARLPLTALDKRRSKPTLVEPAAGLRTSSLSSADCAA
jgi:hypothetical protein